MITIFIVKTIAVRIMMIKLEIKFLSFFPNLTSWDTIHEAHSLFYKFTPMVLLLSNVALEYKTD